MTNQLPAHLQAYATRDIGATALANLGASMPPHVSIGNNRFTLIDAANNEIPVPTFDPKLGPYLDACIIDVADVMSRIYFSGTYDAGADGMRPDCFSDNGVGPSISASSPQAPTCAACPRSEWTKVNANGKKVPWCTQKYKVALLIPGFDTVFLLAVPPNSHGPLREYLATCKGNGAMMENLVTRISFISQGTLQFHPLSWIDAAVAALRERAYAEKKTDLLVGRNDMARPAGVVPAGLAIQPGQQAMQAPQGAGTGTLMPPAIQPGQSTTGWQQPTGQSFVQGYGAPGPTAAWPAQQAQPIVQQPAQQTQWPQQGAAVQQVQQPSPFVAAPVQHASFPGPITNQPAPTAATSSPSEQPAAGRRKRRTQAEIAAANAGQQVQQPGTGSQQAPFPHPGANVAPTTFPQSTSPAALPGQLEFGIGQGQDANANPEVKNMLDSFFGGQS